MSSLHDLLPIPRGTAVPNAYDAFGLQPGEQDLELIRTRIASVVQRLKSVQDQSDPAVWRHAARFVDQSRKLLADPKRKAALDAQLHRAAIGPHTLAHQTSSADPPSDPLAGLLPTGDPLQPVDIPESVGQVHAVAMPPGLFGTPGQPADRDLVSDPVFRTQDDAAIDGDRAVVANPVANVKHRRRRGLSWTHWMLGLLTLSLVATAGLLAYFVFARPGTLRIVKSDRDITISTDRPVGQEVSKSDRDSGPPPREPLSQSPQSDERAIQPNLKPDSAGSDSTFGRSSGVASGWNRNDSAAVDLPTPQRIDQPMTDRQPQNPSPDAAPADRPMLEDAQQSGLANVQQLIRDANWSQMKGAAETLAAQNLSDANQELAQGLVELTDLATYYRVGIEQAVAKLSAGNEIAITDAFRVVVVETDRGGLTVRYNKKNRTFTFDEFPLSLAHRLASHRVTQDDTGQAAKAVYQAIAPIATPAQRDESIGWLRAMEGEIQGADRDRLVRTIEWIYNREQE